MKEKKYVLLTGREALLLERCLSSLHRIRRGEYDPKFVYLTNVTRTAMSGQILKTGMYRMRVDRAMRLKILAGVHEFYLTNAQFKQALAVANIFLFSGMEKRKQLTRIVAKLTRIVNSLPK